MQSVYGSLTPNVEYVDSEYGDPEDELIEKITDKTGWCIKSIKYCENRPHRLTSFK